MRPLNRVSTMCQTSLADVAPTALGVSSERTFTRRPRRAPATALAILLAACGAGTSPPSGSDVETAVDTVEGVVHVRNAGRPPAWTTEPVLRLGSVGGGPEEFGRIRSLVADADGNVYVADNLADEIRVFTPEGRHLRTIGRQGGGPGEFGDLYSLAWLDGNLAAMDPSNARIGILSRDGEWVDGIQHFPITGPATQIRLHSLEQGFYAPTIGGDQTGLSFARIAQAGVGDASLAPQTASDTIQAPQAPEDAQQTGVVCRRPDDAITFISVPQAPALVYGFPPSGGEIVVSWTDSYRLAHLTPGGDTVRVVTRERPPVPYPEDLWGEATQPYRQLRQNYPGSECDPSAPVRPAHRSFLRHIVYDDEGRMWVEAASETGFAWEIFDPDGRLLATAPAPERAGGIPPYVRAGHLYQVETDDLDVQYVAVYRISPQE